MSEKFFWIVGLLRDFFFCPLPYLFFRNKKKFLCGAWSGRQCSDNPKYFMLYLLEHTDALCIWIGHAHLKTQIEALNYPKSRLRFVEKGSFRALWHFLTAGNFVCNVNWRSDILNLPSSSHVKILNLWHGIPLKHLYPVKDIYLPKDKEKTLAQKILINWSYWLYPERSYLSVSSQSMVSEMIQSHPRRFSLEKMVLKGLSRNDFLIRNKNNQALCRSLKQKYAKLLNLPVDKRWYLYLPTFRDWSNDFFSFAMLKEQTRLKTTLEDQNAIIIEKQHPRILQSLHLSSEMKNRVRVVSETEGQCIDLQELMFVSDRMVTDYSSCFFDFELLQRPVIHFAYDYELYKQERGVIYELQDICAGPVVTTQDDLLTVLAQSDETLLQARGPHANAPIEYEQGHASRALYRKLFAKES